MNEKRPFRKQLDENNLTPGTLKTDLQNIQNDIGNQIAALESITSSTNKNRSRIWRWLFDRRNLFTDEMCEAAAAVNTQATSLLGQENISEETPKDFYEALYYVKALLRNSDDLNTYNQLIALSEIIEGARIPWRQNLGIFLGVTSGLAILAGGSVLTLVGLALVSFPPLTIALISLGIVLSIAVGTGAFFLHRSGKPTSLAATLIEFADKVSTLVEFDNKDREKTPVENRFDQDLGYSANNKTNSDSYNPFATIKNDSEKSPSERNRSGQNLTGYSTNNTIYPSSYSYNPFATNESTPPSESIGSSTLIFHSDNSSVSSTQPIEYTNIIVANGREEAEEAASRCEENTILLCKKPGESITYSVYFIKEKNFVMQQGESTIRKSIAIDNFTEEEINNPETNKQAMIDKVMKKVPAYQPRTKLF